MSKPNLAINGNARYDLFWATVDVHGTRIYGEGRTKFEALDNLRATVVNIIHPALFEIDAARKKLEDSK